MRFPAPITGFIPDAATAREMLLPLTPCMRKTIRLVASAAIKINSSLAPYYLPCIISLARSAGEGWGGGGEKKSRLGAEQ